MVSFHLLIGHLYIIFGKVSFLISCPCLNWIVLYLFFCYKFFTYCCYKSFVRYQFSSVTHLCPTLCNPMNCSMPGFPVHHQLPELAQDVSQVGDAIQQWHGCPFSFCLQSFPASGSFPMSQFFASGSQSIGASALASVLPKTIQG